MTNTNRDIAEATKAAREAAARATNSTAETVEEFSDDVEDAAERATDVVGDLVDDVRAKATDAAESISEQAREAYTEAKDAADDGIAYVQAKYRENPVLVIGVAIAAFVAVTAIQGNVRLGVTAISYDGVLRCAVHCDADALDAVALAGALQHELTRITELA